MFVFKPVETVDEREQLHRLRYRVYGQELNWIDSSFCRDEKEIDKYDEHSTHFIALKDKAVVATSRSIFDSVHGFPAENAFQFKPPSIPRDKLSEMSRATFDKNVREHKQHLILGLGREMYQDWKRKGVTHVYGISDSFFFGLIQEFTGVQLSPLSESKFYMGSETYPILMVLCDLECALKAKFPDVYKFFIGEKDSFI